MLKIYSKTDIGKVRSSNQDSCAFGEVGEDAVWAVVCDGMGGANGGKVASSVAAEKISEHLMEDFSSELDGEEIRNLIEAAIQSANSDIFEMAQEDPELSGMGTTVVVVVVKGIAVHVAHVGDSRVYCVGKEEIKQLTKDHSMVQMMVENGQITESEAKTHPRKNIITRAVGVMDDVAIDFCDYELSSGDRLLLCSDGLTNFIDDEDLLKIINSTDEEKAVEKLVDIANENGGGDNITVVMICSR